jgi:peroxin-5
MNVRRLVIKSHFLSIWKGFLRTESLSPKEELAKWESELSQLMNSERDHLEDLGKDVQKIYEDNDFRPAEEALRYDDEGIPLLSPYVFGTLATIHFISVIINLPEKNNPYLDSPGSATDLLNQAKAVLEQNGSFSEAALMLEGAIQRGEEGEGGYEAWVLLGETRNMDEREEVGMRALMEGVKRAEAVGSAAGMLVSCVIDHFICYYSDNSLVTCYLFYQRILRQSFTCHVAAMVPNGIS